GLPLSLICINILRILLSTISVLLNISFTYVTVKIRTLNSPCHLLLAFDCLVSAWYQSCNWFTITVLFNANFQFINVRTCCLKILPLFEFGYTSSFNSIFLISIDRLISVLFPIWYNQQAISKKYYFIPMFCSILLTPAIILYAQFNIVFTVPETFKILCTPTECSWGWAADLTYFIFSSFYGLTLLNYLILWIVLKWKVIKNENKFTSSYAWTHKILKTLSVIMLINFIGLFMNSIARIIVPRFNLNITEKSIIIYSLSCLISVVMSSNAPILFTLNDEYRNAFLIAFKIKKINKMTTKVNNNNCK
ncbi:hypothetical protein Mgra_00009372, partial [Meloidogyne graminicola]